MPRHCTVCDHPEREAIDRLLVEGGSKRTIANHFSLSDAAVQRHKSHLNGLLIRTKETEELSIQSMPWERQPDESDEAFQAFTIYRDMASNRSMVRVSTQLGKSRTLIERWAKHHSWASRVRAYDNYLDRMKRKDQEKDILEMCSRHATQAKGILQILTIPMRKLLERMAKNPKELEKLYAMEIVDLIEMVSKYSPHISQIANLERLSRGLATERVGADISTDDVQEDLKEAYGNFTVEELRHFLQSIRRARRSRGRSPESDDTEGDIPKDKKH